MRIILYIEKNMKNQELIRLLKSVGYSRINIENDSFEAKTFYLYRGGLHINGSRNLSFHIVAYKDSLGLGRFATCVLKKGEGYSTGTDCPDLFYPRLLSFLRGETTENEIIHEIAE